jgi:hypothetical protein
MRMAKAEGAAEEAMRIATVFWFSQVVAALVVAAS